MVQNKHVIKRHRNKSNTVDLMTINRFKDVCVDLHFLCFACLSLSLSPLTTKQQWRKKQG